MLAGLLIGAAIVTRFWERPPVDESRVAREIPAVVVPDIPKGLSGPELARLKPRIDVDTLVIDAPELRPKAVAPAIDVPSVEVATREVKPGLPAVDKAEAEPETNADELALASVKMKSAPEVVARGSASRLEPTPVMARAEVVAEAESRTEEETSGAAGEPVPVIELAETDTLSEPSSEILEESSATSSNGVEVEVRSEAETTATAVERETKPRDGRRKRERRRVMGQINRYR